MLVPVNVRSEAGIKRDGTKFEGNFYVDGQWVRFQRGLPRKIGGYRQISNFAEGVVRQFHLQAQNNFTYTHMGYGAGVQQMTIDNFGNTSSVTDRTPASYVGGDGFMWQFDALYDGAGSATALIAHAANSADDISTDSAYPAYIGIIDGTSALTPISTAGVSGGVVVLHPYLFMFSSNGFVKWSDANDPTNFTTGDAGDAFISSSKIVKGLPLRGGGQNPAGLLWTLDSLIRVYYTGGTDVFAFDTISSSSSIIAVNSVIEYDGIYFWVGDGRFMMYNGVVREVPNNMNINYFLDGLNQPYANKIFAYKVPRFGEIWWCYPRGEATECTHAVVYNFRENTWYDTELPNSGRSAGIYSGSLNEPILAGIDPISPGVPDIRITENDDTRVTEDNQIRVVSNGPTRFKIWQHEFGVDEIDGAQINAIESFFETGDIALIISDPPKNRSIHVEMMEPDFVQAGDMTVQITGRINARAPEISGPLRTFPAVPAEKYEQQVFFKEQRRELRFRFASNTVGGNYQMGQVIVHIEAADGRYQS